MKSLSIAVLIFLGVLSASRAAKVVAIGDSLTAEYDTIPDIPGFSEEATAYAEVSVPGWVSRSWVEVLRKLHRNDFDFGGFRRLSAPWNVPRLSGYEFNWGIPGIDAAQYEDFLTSSVLENPAFWALRQPLEDQLRGRVERVVIWLGTNESRGNYGFLYDGGDPASLIDGLLGDIEHVVDFVQRKNRRLQIVLANVPDLGASPSKKAAHPDRANRARVTAATEAANVRIAALAAAKGVALADVYAQTARLVAGVPRFFGAVEMIDDLHPDNDPHYQFTRDGLHPNTPSQIEIARIIIRAFNEKYRTRLPQITDTDALRVLGIDPNEPFFDWLTNHGLPRSGFRSDHDGDGLLHLVEYAFALNPAVADADQLPVTLGGPVDGLVGDVSIRYRPDPARARHVRVRAQHSSDGVEWRNVPATNIRAEEDGSFSAVAPVGGGPLLRVKVRVIPPSGSPVASGVNVLSR